MKRPRDFADRSHELRDIRKLKVDDGFLPRNITLPLHAAWLQAVLPFLAGFALAERPSAWDEPPSRRRQMKRDLRGRKEAIQQHLHVRHIARRLTRIGQLL
jgi:hypothetical protein